MLRRGQERFRSSLPGGGGGGDSQRKWLIIAAAIIGLWVVFSSFYRVDPQERAVVTRFGKYTATTGPGMHFKLPTPIDRVRKVPVESVSSIDIGSRSEEHTSELQSLMRISYAVFCLKKKNKIQIILDNTILLNANTHTTKY